MTERETLGDLLQEHMARQKAEVPNEHGEVQTPGNINWTDENLLAVKGYGEQIAEVKAHYPKDPVVPDGHVVTSTHEENAAKFFAQQTGQTVSRVARLRGVNPHILYLDDAGFLKKEDSEKIAQYPEPTKIRADIRITAADCALEVDDNGIPTTLESAMALDAIDAMRVEEDERWKAIIEDDEPEITNEQLAEHYNQGLIAEGRAPVYSAQMLAAQGAAELRKKQKARKKKRK